MTLHALAKRSGLKSLCLIRHIGAITFSLPILRILHIYVVVAQAKSERT